MARSGRVTPARNAEAALHWLTRHLASDRVRRAVGPDRSLLMTYEAFVRRPVAAMEEGIASLTLPGSSKAQIGTGLAVLTGGFEPVSGSTYIYVLAT